jgi:hypothetical protein
MSELVDRVITGLAAGGGSATLLEILRRWLQRRHVRILEEGHALRQEAYQREREALQALAEERERRHKAELATLDAQMQGKLEALARANEELTRRLDRLRGKRQSAPLLDSHHGSSCLWTASEPTYRSLPREGSLLSSAI